MIYLRTSKLHWVLLRVWIRATLVPKQSWVAVGSVNKLLSKKLLSLRLMHCNEHEMRFRIGVDGGWELHKIRFFAITKMEFPQQTDHG